MNQLTAEQVKRIEENKKIALEKRLAGQKWGQTTGNIRPPVPKRPKYPPKIPTNNKEQQAVVRRADVSVTFVILCNSKFMVEMKYHDASIDIMKGIPGSAYDYGKKRWVIPIAEHDNLLAKFRALGSHMSISSIPKNVIQCLKSPEADFSSLDIEKIDCSLRHMLMPFQEEGIKFGISRKGRCLIADDMGLGKTIQALGIAHYFFESWPLLIVCPSSMRFPWESAILQFLPSVDRFSIVVVTSAANYVEDANVVIVSYDLLKSSLVELKKKKIGTVIFDESHFLKSSQSVRTKSATEIAAKAQHVILLSGTPALSRPQELFPQIKIIDPTCFSSIYEFGKRYCDGKLSRFGWDFSGSSNSTELEIFMKRKFMIRRMKAEVITQLPSKIRKVVILHPKTVNKIVANQMKVILKALASELVDKRGMEKRGKLLEYYCATGTAKLPAVKEYITDKLETPGKMLVFAHHASVIDGLSDLLEEKRVDYIRIDGATSAESRAALCDRFQSNPATRVAVLSIKAANAGLTLTAAQLVIFAELYWNPGELTQAEDRAHRIGQQDTVCVEYLIAKGTADDHLWTLVESKLKVLNSVGLSKDSFRNAGTEHVRDKTQPLINEALKNADRAKSEQGLTDLSASQVNMITAVDFESLQDVFTEDDIFNSVDWENIENQRDHQ